ncbi:MAG: hypothetical protein HRT67_11595 [Flavobacteriaceae bacterium]|nr:hypothetical protein [Flavobacteriaceae bacterium]
MNLFTIAKETGMFLVLAVSIGVLLFFVSKNRLTQNNSYSVLLFSLFLVIIPETLQEDSMVLSNCFVLLAMRRIVSLKRKTNTKKKLFDAAFWIAIASLFYFWSILFFVLILLALLIYAIEDIKNWLVPFLGFGTVALLCACYYSLTENGFGKIEQLYAGVSLDVSLYNNLSISVGIVMLLVLGFWSALFYYKTIGDQTQSIKASFAVVFIAFLLGIFASLLSPDKNGSEFIFAFAPLAIIMANYIETRKKKWISELYMGFIITTLIILLFL